MIHKTLNRGWWFETGITMSKTKSSFKCYTKSIVLSLLTFKTFLKEPKILFDSKVEFLHDWSNGKTYSRDLDENLLNLSFAVLLQTFMRMRDVEVNFRHKKQE